MNPEEIILQQILDEIEKHKEKQRQFLTMLDDAFNDKQEDENEQ